MATPTIKIDQATLGPGSAGVSRADLIIGQVVTLTDPANGAGSYVWSLVRKPNGSSATLAGSTTDTATFTPDVTGTYLIRLVFDGVFDSGADNLLGEFVSTQGGCAVKNTFGWQKPAAGETEQFDAADGWSVAVNAIFDDIETRITAYSTLDAVYDGGASGAGRTITADSDAVVITSTAADNNNLLEIVKNPAGSQAGHGIDIAMGANTTGAALHLDHAADLNALEITTGRVQLSRLAIGEDSTEANALELHLLNSTDAALGVQQYSPMTIDEGQGWETDVGSSMPVQFARQVRPIQGTVAPTGGLYWSANINGAGFVDLMDLNSAGRLNVIGPANTGELRFTNRTALARASDVLQLGNHANWTHVEFRPNLQAQDATGPAILNEAADPATATIIPDRSDLTTGVTGGSGTVGLIVGGTQGWIVDASGNLTQPSGSAGTQTIMFDDATDRARIQGTTSGTRLNLYASGAANACGVRLEGAVGASALFPLDLAAGRVALGVSGGLRWDGAYLLQQVHTSGTPAGVLEAEGGAHTTLDASTEASDVIFNLSRTVEFNTGALALQRSFRIQAPTYDFVAASTIDDAATLDIDGPPIEGPNATITNPWVIRAAYDTNANFAFGRALIDSRANDIAYFSHVDRTTTTQYALSQNASGVTSINGANPGINFQIAGTGHFSIDTDGFHATNANGPAILNEAAALNNPVLITDRSDLTTGIGGSANTVNIVLGGNDRFRFIGTTMILGSGGTIQAQGAGGLNLEASHASGGINIETGGANTRATIDSNGNWTYTQGVQTSGSPMFSTWTGAAHTTLDASTEAPDIDFDLDRTVEFNTGALALQRAFRIQAPTYAFVGASTLALAATAEISGPPVEGNNATITKRANLILRNDSSMGDFSDPGLYLLNSTGGATIQASPSIVMRGRTSDGGGENVISGLHVVGADPFADATSVASYNRLIFEGSIDDAGFFSVFFADLDGTGLFPGTASVGLGNASLPWASVQVSGTARVGDGTASLPGYAFADHTNTGFYIDSGNIAISHDGTSILTIDSTALFPSTTAVTDLGKDTLRYDIGYFEGMARHYELVTGTSYNSTQSDFFIEMEADNSTLTLVEEPALGTAHYIKNSSSTTLTINAGGSDTRELTALAAGECGVIVYDGVNSWRDFSVGWHAA